MPLGSLLNLLPPRDIRPVCGHLPGLWPLQPPGWMMLLLLLLLLLCEGLAKCSADYMMLMLLLPKGLLILVKM